MSRLEKIPTKVLLTLVFILLASIIFLLRINQKKVDTISAWWDETWTYRQAIDIGWTGSDLTDFQVSFDIGTSALINAGKMQTDCDDIRVTDVNGNLIDYYISNCNSPTTYTWAKLPALPSGGTTIYVYYGNSSANQASDAQKTFDIPEETITTGSSAYSSQVTGVSVNQVTDENGVSALASNGMIKFVGTNTSSPSNQYAYYKTTTPTGDYLKDYVIQSGDFLTFLTYSHSGPGTSIEIDFTDGGYLRGTHRDQNGVDIQAPNSRSNGYWYWRYFDLSDKVGKTINRVDVQQENDTDNVSWIAYYNNITIRQYKSGVSSTPQSEEVTPGPVAYWKFDEGVDTTAHDSAGNNHGIFDAGSSSPSWQTEDKCISGKCVYFGGDGDRIYTPANFKGNFSGITVSGWIKSNTSSATYSRIVSSWTPGFIMALNTNNKLRVYLWDDAEDVIDGVSNINDNNWHHIAFTVDTSTGLSYIYIDGQEEASKNTTITTNFIMSNRAFYFAEDRELKGFLDEVKIYPYARTADQVKADYAAGLAGMGGNSSVNIGGDSTGKSLSDGLIGYWTMDEGVGTTTLDKSGNNNTGTFNNSPTWSTGKYGIGISFPQTASYYVLAGSTGFTNTAGSIAFWIKPNWNGNDSTEHNLITVGSPGTNGLLFRKYTGNVLNFETYNSSDCIGASGYCDLDYSVSDWTANNWHHLVISWDNLGKKMYIDGSLVNSSNNNIFNSTSTGIYIGSRPGLVSSNSTFDEVRIYNRALSASEVKSLYEYAPGPVAHYNFDSDNNTTLKDISSNGNNGTWSGSTTQRYAPGKYGSAGVFNGSNDYINLGTLSSLNFSKNYTISAWIKSTYQSTNIVFLGKYNGSGSDYWFGLATGKLSAQLGCQSTNQQASDGNWHYATNTCIDGTTYLYMDGTLIDTGTCVASNPGGDVMIGKFGSSSSFYWNGLIDDVKIYNYARTPKQILEDMNARSGATKSTLPIAHWKFDEGFGTTARDSIGTNHGTFGTGSSAPTWTNNGKIGKALSFDKTKDQYFSKTDTTNSSLDLSIFTISAWINLKSYEGTNNTGSIILSKGNYPAYNYRIATTTDGYFDVASNIGGTFVYIATSNQPSLNTWYHVTGVSDGSYLKLYINGQGIGSTNLPSTTIQQNNNDLIIGKYGGANGYEFDGLIDEVKIYNYALSADEVKQDYNQGKAMVMGQSSSNTGSTSAPGSSSQEYCVPGSTDPCSPPVAEWKFDEGVGTTTYDTSGNNNFAVFQSNPAWTMGKYGSAINFDNSTDYLSTPGVSISNNWTISAWAKFPLANNGTYRTLVRQGASHHHILVHDNGLLGTYVSGWYSSGFDTNSLNGWHQITAIGIGGTTQFYIDSQFKGNAYAQETGDITQIGGIGSQNWGIADQIRIYNYARTPAQIAWDYNRGKPIAHYKLDEIEGTTAHDSSGNNLHGALGSGDSAPTWTTGKLNNAASFDGNDYVNIGTTAITIGDDMTISTWIKVGNSSQTPIISNRSSGRLYYGLNSNGYGFVYYNSAIPASLSTTTAIDDNTWHNLIFVRSGTTSTFYVDGKYNNSITQTSYVSAKVPINIGYDVPNNEYFPGLIDDVRIYNYALTPDQIKTLYNNGSVSFN